MVKQIGVTEITNIKFNERNNITCQTICSTIYTTYKKYRKTEVNPENPTSSEEKTDKIFGFDTILNNSKKSVWNEMTTS